MFNDIKIGPVTFHMYGLMIAIGFAAALMLCLKRGKKRGLNEDIIYGIFFCAIFGGMIGCRLLYYIVEFPSIIADPSILLDFGEGFVVYGGLIAGFLSPLIYTKIKKLPFLPYLDCAVPGVAFAQGCGRIGCFLAGCCYGKETSEWYGVTFPADCLAPAGVSLIPTQLFSAAGDFIFALILFILQRTLYKKKKKTSGIVTAVYLMLYAVGRFLIEFLRNDPRGAVGVLSTSQFIAIFMFAAGAVMLSRFVKNSN